MADPSDSNRCQRSRGHAERALPRRSGTKRLRNWKYRPIRSVKFFITTQRPVFDSSSQLDRFHAMPALLGASVWVNGWRESVTVHGAAGSQPLRLAQTPAVLAAARDYLLTPLKLGSVNGPAGKSGLLRFVAIDLILAQGPVAVRVAAYARANETIAGGITWHRGVPGQAGSSSPAC